MGLPVLFWHVRPGLHERPFVLYKLRTMTDARGPDERLLPDGERLTGLGRFLRRWSLDELPQLWNVLRGDMSLVGPRPLLMRYLPYFTECERARFEVRPGIAGLAQLSGRRNLPWTERLGCDVDYVRRWSVWLDARLLLKTAVVALRHEGVEPAATSAIRDLDEERRPGGIA
jgi:lipopolysaccharide/colanic/teichoic acid biosynthesis glycosyltransferase